MCGFTGFLEINQPLHAFDPRSAITLMSNAINHRGPDDQGIWIDSDAGIALGHRRLSIIDLSSNGHQPMHSNCGRYVIVFNGEIYNYLEIRRELERLNEAPAWKGNSDTEVMLEALRCWGLKKALKKFSGMFAFALWDRKKRVLQLGRDRLGEKPLYYGWVDNIFLFGSELKALRCHPRWKGAINRDVLALFMQYNCVPAPYSIFKNIFKVLPGTTITFPKEQPLNETPFPLTPNYYWSARKIATPEDIDPTLETETTAINTLENTLKDAIQEQMIADVPLGAFLSGGVDSSTIAALMQTQSTTPIQTFTIGFEEKEYNEAVDAKAVARHLRTNHTELYVTPKEAMEVIPKLPELYDEPFSDSSQIPTFLVSQLARQHVTVCLSGDGGDELFGGYNRYFWGKRVWNNISRKPKWINNAIKKGITTFPPSAWNNLFKFFNPLLPNSIKQQNPGDKLHKLAKLLTCESLQEMYLKLISHWSSSSSLVLGAKELSTLPTSFKNWDDFKDFTKAIMYLDMVCYLPDDILVKVDRASMGVSLEVRVPFLNHRVVELAWKIPMHMKIRKNQGKWLLRQVLYKYVPKQLIERPKMGFAVPIDSWLRGPLRDWAEDLLSPKRLKDEGFFDPEPIRRIWQTHLSGKMNYQHHLWDVLMFQAWLEKTK
jgi:asparagine synthase (glutamine-hydrolysing)